MKIVSHYINKACESIIFPLRLILTLFFFLFSLLAAPAGTAEVRVVDPVRPIYDIESARSAPAAEEMLLVAPRNGTASAQIVVIGEGAAELRPRMGKLVFGDSELPADAVEIRYAHREEDYRPLLQGPTGARPDEDDRELFDIYGDNVENVEHAYYDRLLPIPEEGAELVPVWVSIRVPADVMPGTYTGELTIGNVSVPVRAEVSEWISPDPIDFTTHVGVRPTNRYVAEGRWELVEQQVKFLGAIGANELWLDVRVGGWGGSGDPVIQFTRDGDQIVPDLRYAERYIDLFAEHVGRPTYLIFDYWSRGICRTANRDPAPLHVLVDGKREEVPLPEAGGERLWGAAMGMLADMVEERGWPLESILLGMGGDRRPSSETVAIWQHLAPFASWAMSTHGRGDRPIGTFDEDEPIVLGPIEVGYYSQPYMPRAGRPAHNLGGWTVKHPVYSSGRNVLRKYMAPSQWRNFPNGMMVGHQGDQRVSGGFAGLFMDDLEVRGSWNTRMGFLVHNNSPSFIEPGPEGAGLVPTVRFEMLREGLQETEARVVIERAIAEGRLGETLEQEAKELLSKLYRIRYREGNFRASDGGLRSFRAESHWAVAEYPRWMELTLQLYAMAARVAE